MGHDLDWTASDQWLAVQPDVIVLALERSSPSELAGLHRLRQRCAIPIITIIDGELADVEHRLAGDGASGGRLMPLTLRGLVRWIEEVRSGGLAVAAVARQHE